MNDLPRDPDDDPLAGPMDTDPEGDVTQVFIPTPIRTQAGDPYGLEWLFLCWAWETNHPDWDKALRTLARALHGLEQIGLVKRRTIRRTGGGTHHGFVLTEDGQRALIAMSGEWIDDAR